MGAFEPGIDVVMFDVGLPEKKRSAGEGEVCLYDVNRDEPCACSQRTGPIMWIVCRIDDAAELTVGVRTLRVRALAESGNCDSH